MLLALCAGNSPVTGEFPAQMPVTRSFDVIFDLRRTIGWVNSREVGYLRRHRAHYDVTVMLLSHHYYNIFNSRQSDMPYWIFDALLRHHTNATGSDNDQSCYINVTNYCRNCNPCLSLKWRQHQFIIWIFWPVKISQNIYPELKIEETHTSVALPTNFHVLLAFSKSPFERCGIIFVILRTEHM